jgi:hypothetical protein
MLRSYDVSHYLIIALPKFGIFSVAIKFANILVKAFSVFFTTTVDTITLVRTYQRCAKKN